MEHQSRKPKFRPAESYESNFENQSVGSSMTYSPVFWPVSKCVSGEGTHIANQEEGCLEVCSSCIAHDRSASAFLNQHVVLLRSRILQLILSLKPIMRRSFPSVENIENACSAGK